MSAPTTPRRDPVPPTCAWCLERHATTTCPKFRAFNRGVDAMPPLDECAALARPEVRRA